jgi:hypothetical protein
MKTPGSLLQTLINREHTLEVSAERLTRIIGRQGFRHQNLVTEPIEAVSVEISPGILSVSGRFHRDRWSGRFHLHLRPTQVIWEELRHTLFFELLDHDIQFDPSLRGVLASIGIATANGLFGKNFILQKTIAALDGSQVQFELDHLNPKLQPLLEAFTLHRIECVDNALQVRFSTGPRKVLRSCGRLAMDWFNRQSGR